MSGFPSFPPARLILLDGPRTLQLSSQAQDAARAMAADVAMARAYQRLQLFAGDDDANGKTTRDVSIVEECRLQKVK